MSIFRFAGSLCDLRASVVRLSRKKFTTEAPSSHRDMEKILNLRPYRSRVSGSFSLLTLSRRAFELGINRNSMWFSVSAAKPSLARIDLISNRDEEVAALLGLVAGIVGRDDAQNIVAAGQLGTIPHAAGGDTIANRVGHLVQKPRRRVSVDGDPTRLGVGNLWCFRI